MRVWKPSFPLPPDGVDGATRAGRVWTNNDPILLVDAEAAGSWTASEDEYGSIGRQPLEVGGLRAAPLQPEIDEGPIEVFTLPDGGLLFVSVEAADERDWDEFLGAAAGAPTQQAGWVDVPSGRLAAFHAAVSHSELAVVEGPRSGRKPFADELLLLSVRPASYELRESYVDAARFALIVWRLEAESR